jgi:hypothetical protein
MEEGDVEGGNVREGIVVGCVNTATVFLLV